jgi:hypothetical protein
MRLHLDYAFHAAHLALLRCASLLVPHDQRSEWQREWVGELWHVRRSAIPIGAFSWQAQVEVTAFCAGALPDALAVRRHCGQSGAAVSIHESAGQCVLSLCIIVIVCAVLAYLLPGVRAEYLSARFQIRPGSISVAALDSPVSQPSISLAQFHAWRASSQRYMDGLAFYRTTVEPAPAGIHRLRNWHVASATPNLFSVLELPIQMAPNFPTDESGPVLILSREVWVRDFGGNPLVRGGLVRLGGKTMRVAGVVSYGSWQLPGRPDVWLLENKAGMSAAAPGGTFGYVIAHLSPLGQAEMSGPRVSITDETSDLSDLVGTSFGEQIDGPTSVFLFAVFLALLALPAVTSMSMSESSFSSHRPSLRSRISRWGFLAAKFTLGACIAFSASCDLAYWNTAGYSSMAEFEQFMSAFLLCLFIFRWAILDQRKRCPVCLRRVTHPAQVGLASCTFLGWNGTEMMCTGGHTLLHVPSLPTSWFSSQRWLYLDASWDFLFAGGDVP